MFFTKAKKDDDDIKTIDQVLSNDSFDALRVDFKSLNLEVKAGNKFEIKYHGSEYKKPEIDEDDGVMNVKEPDVRDKEIKRWEKGFFKIEVHSSHDGEVTITLPQETELEQFDLHMMSGNVRMKQFAINDLQVESMSGNLDGKTLKLGTIDISVTSGNINLDEVRAKAGEISLTSGDFRLENSRVSDKLEVSTVSGDNLVKNIQVGRCHLSTVSGNNRIFGKKSKKAEISGNASLLKMATVSGDNTVE